ncbi:hypothetical protein LCGC14_2128800, partial [marine sediment metagenome]
MTQNLPAVQQKASDLRSYLGQDNVRKQFEMALPKWLSVDRLLRIIFSATIKNPRILDCTKESILRAVMQCAQTGLEPILGRAYLIPYHNSKKINDKWVKVWECEFQPGYQGLVDLARRSGEIKDVFAMVVYENDDFDMEYGTNRKLEHRPTIKGDPGEPIGAYAVWELKDGTKPFEFMPLHELYKRRDKSKAYQFAIKNPKNKNAQDCPWIQWPEEQMMKTVVKHSSKLKPASIEYMQAAELDNSAESGQRAIGFFDNPLLPEPDVIKPTAEDFTRLVSEKIDYLPDPTLDKYLKEMAGAQTPKMTVDQFKAEGAAQFEELWTHFEQWKGTQRTGPDLGNKKGAKKEEMIIYGGPWDQPKWWKTRKGNGISSGFAKFVNDNIDTFTDASPKLQAKAVHKWDGFYPDIPFPMPEPKGQGEDTDKPPLAPEFVGLAKARENLGEDVYAQACETVFALAGEYPHSPDDAKRVVVEMNRIADSDVE